MRLVTGQQVRRCSLPASPEWAGVGCGEPGLGLCKPSGVRPDVGDPAVAAVSGAMCVMDGSKGMAQPRRP
eukprot:11768130-Prorocentrum_lima.AAC.1